MLKTTHLVSETPLHSDCSVECSIENHLTDNTVEDVEEIELAHIITDNFYNEKINLKEGKGDYISSILVNTQHLEYETPPPEQV